MSVANVRAVSSKHYTIQEYLELEERSDEKHEYHGGERLIMTGGTLVHSRICLNVGGEVRQRLKGSPCFAFESNTRVAIAAFDRSVYPDVGIICGDPEFDPADRNRTTVVNPTVIFEVLSESTEGYDRGAKFAAYRTLPSLREYVLVAQVRPTVETFLRRDDGAWVISGWDGVESVAKLQSVGIDLPLAEVYAGLTFEPDATPTPEADEGHV